MSVNSIRWGPWLDDMDRIYESLSEIVDTLEDNRSDSTAIENSKIELHSVKGLLDSVGFKISVETIVEIEENFYQTSEVSDELFKQLKEMHVKLGRLIDHVEENKPKPTEIPEIDKAMGFESILVKFGADYSIEITIKAQKSERSARALAALNIIKRIGRIKSSNPKEEDLYLDTKFDTLKIVLSTRETQEQIHEDIKKIPNVDQVQIEKITQTEDDKKDLNVDALSLKIPLSQIRQLEAGLATLSSHIEALKTEVTTIRGSEELTGIDNTFERLKNDLKKMRKVPFDSIVSPLMAMTSRLAQKEGKQVDLVIQGRFVTLDRAIANYLIDPITQILRNAIIHGIEKVNTRRKVKKDFVGKILLSAVNDRDKIKIRIIDDGQGIDVKELEKAARDAGISMKNYRTNEQKLNLIFEKGLSLSKTDVKLAGRGVGLYAARDRLSQFGGNISVSSELGKGTTFTIEFTDQDALSKNLIVQVGNEAYAIPSSEVEHVKSVRTNEIELLTDSSATYKYENEDLPVVILGNLIGRPKELASGADHIVVIVRGQNSLLGILVDSLMDERLVNVKPLNPILQSYKLFNGTMIGRNKEVILVVNPAAII
ncbi:MAG: chemotaxis protein CheW [Candidatus Heimdallarchaeota archaeon]|nr:chemotaxis protein CheW [Candidatus Heimdallarchaeota archaeon]